MTELTDLEVCKKIADIEDIKVTEINNELLVPDYEESAKTGYDEMMEYNPLTDDALCFRLMVKYEVQFSKLWEENDGTPHYQCFVSDEYNNFKCDKSPNKAICLAIIESKK